ncbi:MAG: hypothetical protein KKH02_11435 [Proteobacteria bacterium]|nr:hypothetical protein [Pseudomonadota bacterium]MCG2740301.1 hypothetical protein [Syntrophaceae bacterium]
MDDDLHTGTGPLFIGIVAGSQTKFSGIFGIEAAALAVVLPSPLHYHPVEGGRYVESRTEAVYRIMVRRAIVIPEYEQMLNEPAGNGSPPMQFTGDADLTREPCADYGDLPGC